jgi:capsular polysaccharide export protein
MKYKASDFTGKRILLLQGPVGPFFNRLRLDLEAVGATVFKINFNGGDVLFYPQHAMWFRSGMYDWGGYFLEAIQANQIDLVMLMGDCRPIHQIAHAIAKKHNIEVAVFEEGYIRPDFITIERDGVNGFSNIPKDPQFYFKQSLAPLEVEVSVGKTFGLSAMWAMMYYLACFVMWPAFFQYQHHRTLNLLEGLIWVRGFWRKRWYQFKERYLEKQLSSALSQQYYLLPLQVHNDSQLHVHSNFASIDEFISYSIKSFAQFAPSGTHLVIKHHPLDRGYHDYTRLIQQLSHSYGVQARIIYLHDQHLPTLLTHCKGVVLINSTVGMSALHHYCPLKACGEAIYNIEGLTYQGDLDSFWLEASNFKPDTELLTRFKNYVVNSTQINGNFYKPLKVCQNHSGTNLFPAIKPH